MYLILVHKLFLTWIYSLLLQLAMPGEYRSRLTKFVSIREILSFQIICMITYECLDSFQILEGKQMFSYDLLSLEVGKFWI
jgi:hypothetical protein